MYLHITSLYVCTLFAGIPNKVCCMSYLSIIYMPTGESPVNQQLHAKGLPGIEPRNTSSQIKKITFEVRQHDGNLSLSTWAFHLGY